MVALLRDDRGQLILIACAMIAISIVLMATYEYAVMGAGQGVIKNEVRGAPYYYMSGRDAYLELFEAEWANSSDLSTMQMKMRGFERDIKNLTARHGYSFDLLPNETSTSQYVDIVFADKDMVIKRRV